MISLRKKAKVANRIILQWLFYGMPGWCVGGGMPCWCVGVGMPCWCVGGLKATRSNNQLHVYVQYYKIIKVHYDKPHMFVMIPYKCQRVQTQEIVEISQTAPYIYTI